jgi:DNA-binding NtrC family response regulator
MLNAARNRQVVLGPTAVASLARYDWPGNVRELRNVLERTLVFWSGVIESFDRFLPAEPTKRPSLRLDDVMRAHVLGVLERSGGNRTVAAKKLGIGRSTLRRKLREYRVTSGDSRSAPEISVERV